MKISDIKIDEDINKTVLLNDDGSIATIRSTRDGDDQFILHEGETYKLTNDFIDVGDLYYNAFFLRVAIKLDEDYGYFEPNKIRSRKLERIK